MQVVGLLFGIKRRRGRLLQLLGAFNSQQRLTKLNPMQSYFSARLTTLGFAVVVLAVGLAPPTAQAQTESYITDADEAAACEGVCNTYVPPQTEDECKQLHRDRFNEETLRHHDRSGRLANRRAEEWEESLGIFFDEMDAITAVRDEKIVLAKAAYATAIAGYTAGFAACMALTTPTPGVGWALCTATYVALAAKAGMELDRKVAAAREVFKDQNELAAERLEDREDKIKALYDDRLIPNEVSRHESAIALIDEDLRLCLDRVSQY